MLGLAIASVAIALPASLGGQQRPGAPMNVVVLVIDDTRWDSIGAAGNRVVRTPNIDRLASEGVHFTQARVTTSICMTSRASLLTGQYMSRHGIDQFGKPLTPRGVREDISRRAAGAADTGPATSASTTSAHRGRATSISCGRITGSTG